MCFGMAYGPEPQLHRCLSQLWLSRGAGWGCEGQRLVTPVLQVGQILQLGWRFFPKCPAGTLLYKGKAPPGMAPCPQLALHRTKVQNIPAWPAALYARGRVKPSARERLGASTPLPSLQLQLQTLGQH